MPDRGLKVAFDSFTGTFECPDPLALRRDFESPKAGGRVAASLIRSRGGPNGLSEARDA